jgi:ABC-type multidrug transport system ATPase subunit
MKISLINAGKRFNREWIFRNIDYTFFSGQAYAITGPNGSGKSTLLQSIGGALLLSEGEIHLSDPDQGITPNKKADAITENWHTLLSIAAPYLELIEEYTLLEFLRFHRQFKSFRAGMQPEKIIEILNMTAYRDKQIRVFSSGMKQRVRLAQAILSEVPVILLDEPCTNLDQDGIQQYHSLINEYCADRLLIVSSNDPAEYSFCRNILHLSDFKKASPKGEL